jgi:FtsP/CotA-like multicopper oxidase with cupredoxin domain
MYKNVLNSISLKKIKTFINVLSFFLITVSVKAETPLDPMSITKWMDSLAIPKVMQPMSADYYEIGAYPIYHKFHSQLPPTYMWGYGSSKSTASFPANTIEAVRNRGINVKWTNNLVDSIGKPLQHIFSVDQTLHWADPKSEGHSLDRYTGPVPIVTHLHGSESESNSDGGPDAWFTPGFDIKGSDWVKEDYTYFNEQPPTTLWYHDHTMGITRLNVYAGLAGAYILRDLNDSIAPKLPKGKYEIPLIIQDRLFYSNGAMMYPDSGVNPEVHPFWTPEFFGNVVTVNGVIWPYLNVEPRKYRFRLLNGSNARFYNLSFPDGLDIVQIGTDGGYLPSPVTAKNILIAPGERADIIIDFSKITMGTNLLLKNDAASPFPDGDPIDDSTTAFVMQFRVSKVLQGIDSSIIPSILRQVQINSDPTVTRTLTLNEKDGDNGPDAAFLDGKMWVYMTTETPRLGSTEVWKIVNMTEDAHPIHIHLIQFMLVNRQTFNVEAYEDAYGKSNPIIPVPMDSLYNVVPVETFLSGSPRLPEPNEMGFKDTYVVYPGEVTTFKMKFAPQEGNSFPFDATLGPGYVWHCHILDHEDNNMMRPYKLLPEGTSDNFEQSINISNSILNISPNPIKDVANISYSLNSEAMVNLSILDIFGNTVALLVSEMKSAGNYTVNIPIGNISNGIYFCNIIIGKTHLEKSFVIMK